jgi:hypothetical protein
VAGRYVALLRGINVGTAKRVAMTEFRALVEKLGYSEVRTLLNSGNIVFSAARLPAFHRSAAPTPAAPEAELREAALRIQKMLEGNLGVSARVTVISAEELREEQGWGGHRKHGRWRRGSRGLHVDAPGCDREQAQRCGEQGAGRQGDVAQLGNDAEAEEDGELGVADKPTAGAMTLTNLYPDDDYDH